ncbi:hypothetical protein KDX23_07660 [Burkholderia vietnamiensis]|uniref:hypothetical protein n=1 Tax=Burkholderia vietnamiensis TaxID=60552 RepID=UPI001BA0231B|nr:hypothetical protein [Burkholderia vietnamiensis]MBR8082621.1 hypothetical protein [Burkholderia vietnamiensis]
MTTTQLDHDTTTAAIAQGLLAWLMTRDQQTGTLRQLCARDARHAALWASLPHGWRRKVGRAFNRLVREGQGSTAAQQVWCTNLPAGRPHVHARYRVATSRG